MANETDSVFAANHQNGDGELHRFIMSILKEGETDEQETAQQQQATEVEKANDGPAAQQTAAVQTATEPQSVQRPTGQKQERPEQAEQPKGEVGQPAQTVQPVQGVQADELDEDTKDLLAIKNHSIDDARKYVEKLGKEAQTIMASGMSEGAKREAQERYENAAKTLNERIETHNAEQKAENDRLRAEAERKQAQAKKKHDEMYADINYISDWMDGHKVSDSNNTMLASEGFKEGAAAASGKDIFGIAKTAKEYISENTGKLSTAAINDYVNGMLAANRLKEKYGDKLSYNLEPIDSVVLENKDIPDSVKKEFVKVRTPKEFGDNNYQTILGNAVDDFVRLFEKEYRREQGKAGKKAMEDYDNIAKNPFADADDKDAARMVYASKVLTGVDLKPMIYRAFNSIPKDRMAALTLALSKDFGYDENKAAEYIANEFQRVCLARTGAKVNSDTEAVIIGGLMNTLVGSIAQASMRSTGGGNGLTLLDAYSVSIDERAKEWAKQGLAGYGKIALRSATTMGGDSPLLGGIGKLVGGGTKWSLVRLLPRISKGVTPKAGEAAFKLLSMTNSGRVVIGVANGAGLGAIYSPAAYSLGSLARGVTPELGEALKSSASGAVDFSMMGFTPSIMNYGADKVLKLFNGTGKAATTIRVATNIAFKDIFGPGANAALVTAKDVLLSSEKISEDLKSYYFEKFGEFLGMHVPGKLSNIRHIADEYKVRTQLNESVFTKEELRSLGYKSVKQMFDDIYAPNGKNSHGYFMKDGKAIASKLYGITVNPKVLESAKMKLLTAIGGGAIATPTITRSEIVSEYGEKGKEVYTVRTYTADGKAFSERDFGSLGDAKLEETRLGTVIKRNNVAIAEGARDAQWMDTCSERAARAVLSELNGTATEKELTDMLKTAFEKDRNGEQLTDGEKRMLKRFDEVYLQNLRSENADNSSSVRRDFNKSRGVDIDKILAKDYYKWSESEREAVDEYIKALNGENTAKDMPSEQTEPTAQSEPPAEPANEPPVVEAEKGGQQEVSAPEKEADKPSEETKGKGDIGIEDYIKINKADDETANDIREDAENYTDEVNALRSESEQAVRYSNGESSEKPEHWDYWKGKFGLEEPKAKTEEDARPVEEPKKDSEPIEPADEKPTEQPMVPKVEEKPVEVETPKEEAKADTKTEVEQAAETEPVEETEQEQPTVDQLNQYFSHVHLGHELTEKDLGDKARMEMLTKQFLADKEQAIKYSNGELSEKPEGYAYMKQMFGLKDPVKQPTTNKGKTEKDANKTAQLDIINKSNPMRDEQHPGIRSVDDIKTFKEAVSDSEAPFTPDYTKEDAESALKAGEITVYSSKPIEDGVFVTPSKMEAKNYAGGGKVFSKRVSIEDVAWIDTMEGQYARIDNKKSQEESRNGAFETIYKQFKGKAKEAIAWLIQKKEGEAIGALHHRDVGDISLVWGNDNAGLKKILQKHPEVVDNLQDLIDEMHVISSSDNRVVLESETHKAVVSKKIGKENTPQWLLTAYEKKDASGGSSDIGPEPQRGKQNGTAPLQDIAPDSKDTHEVTEEQEKQRKNADKSPNSVAYKKGEELVVEHEGNPTTIVVDAVGKSGDVTKSHVKSSGEPYHSNGKVVFTQKEKPQEQAVRDWVDDTASEARKRGYRIVNGQKVERQGALSEGTEVVYGDEHTTKFSQNDKPTTRFAVVSAKKVQPSHIRGQRNPAFFNDEGQPKNRTDQVSVAREEEIAKNIDPEEITFGVTAYQGAPTINSRGEVIQGNNRAAALREMYSGGYGMSVKKYRQFLKDNAKMFGLTPEDIDRVEDPVLVNVADVADAEAIRLGQLKATDNESGGVQFIEPKPTVQKLVSANKLTRFMDTLLDSENPMDSVKDLIRKNGVKALKFMRDMGIINETQYNSAFNAKDTLSSQARSDLEGVIRHAMFDGGPTGIEEMFDLMPDAAQKGILETIARDFSSDEQSRIKPVIQESIFAYHNAVSTSKEFANAKTAEQAARAMRNYARQVQLIGEEQVLPEKYFSKFALLLAERYRAYSKLSIKAMFNELYDKLQGVSESSGDLFAGEVAAEKLNINEAFKKIFNYGDTELPRGDVLGDTARTGEKGEPGSEGGTGGRGQDKTGERGADGQGGTGGTAEEGPNSLIGTASKVADRERVNSRLKDLSERANTAKTDEERAQVASERAEVVSEYVKGEKGRSVSVVPTQDALADAVESRDLKNEVRQHTENGDLLNGVYDKRTGKIHIVAENVETADDIDAVYIHESSHKYSREVDNNRAAGELVDTTTTEELEQALREVAGDDVTDVYMACKASKGEFAYRRMLADEILAYSCVKRNAGEKTGITNDKINNQTKQHYEKVSDYFGGRKRDGGKSDRGKTETGEGVSPEPSAGEHGRGGANDRKEEGIDSDGLFSVSGKRELKDNTLMPDSEKPEWLKKTKASSGDGEEMTLGEYYDTLYGRRRRMMPTISPLLERAKEKITDDGHLAANDIYGRVVSDNMFFDNTGELSRYKDWLLGTLEKSPSKTLKEEILREIEYLNQQYTHWNLAQKGRLVDGFGVYGDFAREFGISKETREIAKRNGIDVDEVFKDGNDGFFSVAGRKANGADTGYDSKHSEIEQAVNRELKKNSTSDEIKAEIDRVKKLRAEATKEYLSGKPHSEVAKGDAAALRERLNELNAKKTVAVENERSAKLTEKLADLNSKLIEATESGDTEKVKSLTTEIKRVKTDIGNTGIRSRYKAKISEIKSKSENVSDLAKSLVKYISGELSPILAKEMGKAEFNDLVRSVRDIAKQWNAKDGTEQDRNNLATKLDDTIRKVDDVIVGIETRKLINDLADMLSVKTTKKDSSGKKVGVKVSNTVRIAIETLKGMFRGFDGEFGNGLKSLVKSLDGMLAKKKSLQGRLKELELSEASANERLNSGAINKDEYDAEIEAINRERDDVKSEMANFDTVFSDALSETNDAIDAAVPRTTDEYNKLWNDLMAKQQDEQDGVAQMSAHDKEMLKIMPFVRSLVDVRELFAEADKSQSRLKALEEQWKSDAPTPTDTEMEAANRRDRRLQTALKIREERAMLFAAKDAARKALRDLNNDVRSLLKIGKTQYMAQQQERLEHRSEVAHIGIAAVDTGKERPAGVKGQQEAKESEDKSVGVLRRLWNWVFLAPTESAESMLSRVDVNHFSGDGELYHLIMESERGYSRSEDRRIESVEALRSEIQSKCKELFGSKKPKDGNKRIKFTQTLSGEPVPAEVTKGEALSLYLWSLSEEGRAKLESQGIDAFSISEIKAGLGDNWVKFGEWVVGDFLPKLYDKYNEKYVEKYGTEITRHENYFPFKIYGGDIVTKDELESFDNGNTIPTPSALKERVKHNYQLSTTEDALKILNEHVAEMEDWYHFADMREDISILLSSRAFRETLKLQGPNKWRKFRDAMHTLAGVDKRDESVTSQVINEAQSMYASSAVGFRYWTALKQLQSMIAGVNYSYNPRFQARLFANILMPVGTELLAGKVKNVENTFAGMVGSCYWAWKNLPQFRERYRNGKMGNIMLEYESVVGNSNSLYRWIKKNVSQKGLFLNQVFDAAAVAVYAKSIYDYEYTRSIRKGATEEDAHKYAMTCAETNYNKTQQSSGRAYVSKMQVSGNPIEKGLTTFQTASLGFMRKSINDINDIQRAYRLLRLGKEKPLHSISKGAKATVDLLWDGVVMPASWNLINVIGVAGFYYGAKAIFNALFGGDDDNAPIKDATGKTALDRFIEGHTGDVAFATISAPLQGTILNNLVNSAWSGYGGWTPTMAEGAISEVLRSAGETLKGYKDSDSLSGYIEDLDEDAAKYTIKTVLYALFRGYTGIDMKTVERFYNAFYDYKVNGSSLNLISVANFLSTPMSSMRDHEAKDYYLGAYGKTSETAKDLEDYIVKRAYADGKIFKREVESGGARGKVAELFRSRAFKRDLNKYVDEWAEYHIKDASDAMGYHDEWLKNHERKEIIRKNRELEYSDEQAKQKTDSLKLSLGYEQKSGNSERTLRYNLVHDILRQIKKKLTGGDNDRKEAFALMKELERIDNIEGHTHSDYVKLAEKAGVKDFQMIPKGVSESGKYVNKSDIDNGTVARGEVKGSYGIIATADDVKADARFRKLQDGSEKQKAKAKEVMKMYSDGDISYQDAYRRMTDIGDGLVTAVYASEADRLIKDLKTKLTKAVKAGDDKAADAIMEQIRSIRGKVIDGDMKPKKEVAKMLLNSIE